MTLNATKKLSKHIFRLLKVSEIIIPIGRTNKGNLGISFNENGDDFTIMLDSVPLLTNSIFEDENNIELKAMIEKYLFEQENTIAFKDSYQEATLAVSPENMELLPEEKPVKQTKNVNHKAKKSS